MHPPGTLSEPDDSAQTRALVGAGRRIVTSIRLPSAGSKAADRSDRIEGRGERSTELLERADTIAPPRYRGEAGSRAGPCVMRAVTDRVNGERLVVLGWPRAILMQLGHPLVAAGVRHHSSVRDSAAAPIYRLHATVTAMLGIAFGTTAERAAVITHIKSIHARVNGELTEPVGPFARGTRYSAEDPDLLLWVHATLIDTSLLFYERLVGDLTEDERDEYCREAARIAVELGARQADVPTDWYGMSAYVQRMLDSPTLTVGADAQVVADTMMAGPAMRTMWPVSSLVKRLTVGTLPDQLRAQYAFRWSGAEETKLPTLLNRIKRLRRLTPEAAARWSSARAARRQ